MRLTTMRRTQVRRSALPDIQTAATPPRLAHQFEDLAQQHETARLGIWVFLVTEILFFGGLFTAYAIYRWVYFPAFEAGSRVLDVKLGALNTAVLLGSSLTMALAVRAAQTAQRKMLIAFLTGTMFLGGVFLCIKLYEYYQKFVEHVVPGIDFAPQGELLAQLQPAHLDHVQLFMFFYFAMTLLHALHMIIGMALLAVLVYRARRSEFGPDYFAPVDTVGL